MDPAPAPGSVAPSIVRTVVPFVVGWIVTQLVGQGVEVDEDLKLQIGSLVTVAVGAAYYIAVRLIEQVKPRFGVLLGMAKSPVYDTSGLEAANVAVAEENAALDAEVAVLRDQLATLRAAAERAAAKAPAKKAAAAKKAPAKKAAPRKAAN